MIDLTMPNIAEFPSSRDLKDCHPQLIGRWLWVTKMYKLLYPNDPQPQISQTFRNKADQDREVAEGDSKVSWPNSTHNYFDKEQPASLALDFYFDEGGKASYKRAWMIRVVNLAELAGLFSGGRAWGWDWPHLALCEYSYEVQKIALLPPLPALPTLGPSPVQLANVASQPVVKYYDSAGTPNVLRGDGDILLRISTGSDGEPLLQMRYDREDDGK